MDHERKHINDKSIQRLIRSVKLSKNQFSLTLAYCNYTDFRDSLLSSIREQSDLDIREIFLPKRVTTLFTMIKDVLGHHTPDSAMVIGLESVSNIDDVFRSANQIREEFRNHFPFPLIFWVNETVLNRFVRMAPDFKSWAASPIFFEAAYDELIAVFQQKFDQWLTEIQSTDIELVDANEIDAFLNAFQADLSKQKSELPKKHQAGLYLLQGLRAHLLKDHEAAIKAYDNAIGLSKGTGDRTRQSIILNCLGRCYEKNNDLEKAQKYFLTCIQACKDHPVLTTKFIRDLCRVLRQKKDWPELLKSTEKSPHITKDYKVLVTAHERKAPPETIIQQIKDILSTGDYDSDPGLYIELIEILKKLYYEQKDYKSAFETKQNKLSLEQQFGFRAFIGAGRLKAFRKKGRKTTDISDEIQASGRQLDVNRLIEMIHRPDCKLIVLHGQSGVGKSSILEAGLEPALKQTIIDGRQVIPVLIRKYNEWIKELHHQIMQISKINDCPISLDNISTENILDTFKTNEENHRLTVLLFDQFEEFFFANPDQQTRLEFYRFLHDCLSGSFVKVLLSLREDYIHYLLECDRLANLDMINNDILNKKIRYTLGNFKPDDAASIIKTLTQRAKFQIDEQLIEKIVKNLSSETGEVRPVELQIVGAQLQTESRKTLADYKPRQELIEAFLQEVIQDCGEKNETIAQAILYVLTGENNIRPLKTRGEFTNALGELDASYLEQQMDLVLEILAGSGLVLLIPETPADQYQLVHDYLVEYIRKGKPKMVVQQLEQDKMRRLAEKEQIYQQNKKERKRQRRQTSLSIFIGVIIAGISMCYAWRIANQSNIKERFHQIESLTYSSYTQFHLKHDQLAALHKSIKTGKLIHDAKETKESFFQQSIFSPLIHHAFLNEMISTTNEQNRLEGHSDWIGGIDFSPDGKILASGSGDFTIKLWNVSSGNEIKTLMGHSGAVRSVAFSQSGNLLVSGSYDDTIKLWNVSDGSEIMTLIGHSNLIFSVSFSSDSMILASGSYDNTIKLWNVSDGNEIMTLIGHSNTVRSVDFSPDNKILASGSDDNTIKLWNISNGNEIMTLKGHLGSISSVNFSPDGKILSSGSYDKTIKLWNISNGNEIMTLKGHSSSIFSVNFSPDGKLLASGSSNSTIKLWNISNGNEIMTLKDHAGSIVSVNFSPDGKILASGSDNSTIKFWNVSDSYDVMTLKAHSNFVRSLDFSPDGKILASRSDDSTIKLWNVSGKNEILTLKGSYNYIGFPPRSGNYFTSLNFSQSGKIVASGSYDNTIKIWNVSDGNEIMKLKGHSSYVTSLNFSPNGKILASGSNDKAIKIWNISDGNEIMTLKGHTAGIRSLNFSPDGKILASGSDNKNIKLWNVLDGNEIMTLKGHSDFVRSVDFSPDGKILAGVCTS